MQIKQVATTENAGIVIVRRAVESGSIPDPGGAHMHHNYQAYDLKPMFRNTGKATAVRSPCWLQTERSPCSDKDPAKLK